MRKPMTEYERQVDAAERTAIERRQTSMLQRLRRNGHQVDFRAEIILSSAELSTEDAASFSASGNTVRALRLANGKPCPYCRHAMMRGSRRFPTRDHVKPRRLGGTLGKGNCAIVCAPCNNDKGDMMLDEFIRHLESKNDPRVEIVRGFAKERMGGREA